MTPLLYAAHSPRSKEFLRWLIEKGGGTAAAVGAVDKAGRGLLCYACEGADADTVRFAALEAAGDAAALLKPAGGAEDAIAPWVYALRNKEHGRAILRLCEGELGLRIPAAERERFESDSSWLRSRLI